MKPPEDKYIYPNRTHAGKKVYRLYIPCEGKAEYITENKDKQFLRELRDKILGQDNITREQVQQYKRQYHHKPESMKHIMEYKVSNGETRYMIHHTLNGKTMHHGSYHTLLEAQRVRDCLVKHDWKEECCPVSVRHRGHRNPLNKHISNDRNGRYTVSRNVKKDTGMGYRREIFESGIRSLVEARRVRDWWVEHDWDWSSIDLE